MATNELLGKLNIDARAFVSGLTGALSQGAQQISTWAAKNTPKVSVTADTGAASGELNKFTDRATKAAASAQGALSGITATVNTSEAEGQIARLESSAARAGRSIKDGLGGGGAAGDAAGLASAFGGLSGSLGKLGAVAGVGLLAKEMVSSNAEMERYNIQIGTLIKGTADFKEANKNVTDPLALQAKAAEAAKQRMAELVKFGAETPFELPQIAKAEKVLLGFGLTGSKALKLTGESGEQFRTTIGDIAAGTGVAFDELAVTFGKFSTGSTGEAIARLQELGVVTKEELKGMGVQFDKAGSLVSPVPEALTKAVKIANDKFGGGMKALSNSFEGQMSTLMDNTKQTIAQLGGPIFDVAKTGLGKLVGLFSTEAFQKGIGSIGKVLAGVIEPVLGAVTGLVGPLVGLIEPVANTVVALLAPIGKYIGQVVGLVSALAGQIAGPLGALLTQLSGVLGGVLDTVLSSVFSVVQPLFEIIGPVISLVLDLATAITPLIQLALIPLQIAFKVVAGVLQELLRPIADAAGGLSAWVHQIVTEAVPFINQMVSALMGVIDVALPLGKIIGELASIQFQLFLTVGKAVWNLLSSLVTALFGTSTQAKNAQGATSGASDAMQTFKAAIAAVQSFLTGLQATINGTLAAIRSLVNSVREAIQAIGELDLGKLKDAIFNAGSKAEDAFTKGKFSAAVLAKLGPELADIQAAFDAARPKLPAPKAAEFEAFLKATGAAIENVKRKFDKDGPSAILGQEARNIEVQIEAAKKNLGILAGRATATGTPTTTPAGSGTGAGGAGTKGTAAKKEIEDFTADAERIEAEATKIRNARTAKATEDVIARVRAEYTEKARLIEEDAERQRQANIAKKADAEKAHKVVVGFDDAQAAIARRAAEQLAANRQEEAKALLDAIVKNGDERRKAAIDAARAEGDAVIGEDAAAIRARGKARAEAAKAQAEADVETALRTTQTFKDAVVELQKQLTDNAIQPDAFQAKIEKLLADGTKPVAELQTKLAAAAKSLLDGTIKPAEYERIVREAIEGAASGTDRDVAAAIRRSGAAALKETTALRKALRDQAAKDEDERVRSITDATDREFAERELAARRAHDAELDRLDDIEAAVRDQLAGTTDAALIADYNARLVDIAQARADAEIRMEAEVFDARAEHARATSLLWSGTYDLLTNIADAFRTHETAAEAEARRKKAEDIAKNRQQVVEDYAAGKINLRERNKQLAKLDADRTANEKREASAGAEFVDGVNRAALKTVQKIEKDKVDESKKAQDRHTAIIKSGSATEAEVNAARLGALKAYGIETVAVVADAALQGQDVAKAFGNQMIDITLRVLEAEGPAIIAMIFGKSVAANPIAGPILAGVLTAGFAFLASQAKKVLKLKGGYSRLPGNPADGDSIPALLQPGERVVPERINRKWFDVLDDIHYDRDPTPRLLRRITEGPRLSELAVTSRGEVVARNAEQTATAALKAVSALAPLIERTNAALATVGTHTAATADAARKIERRGRRTSRPKQTRG